MSGNIEKDLSNYIAFARLRENNELERSFIAFILSQSKKMSDHDLLLWDSILANDTLPKINDNRLNSALKVETFNKIGFNQRVEILLGSLSGNYTITTKEWGDELKKKSARLHLVQNIILLDAKNKILDIISSKKEVVIQYAYIALFFLILFFLPSFNSYPSNIGNLTSKIISLNRSSFNLSNISFTFFSCPDKVCITYQALSPSSTSNRSSSNSSDIPISPYIIDIIS
jgi:hypothetical protein